MKKYRACFVAHTANGPPACVFRILLLILWLIFFLGRCEGKPGDDLSNQARLLLLTSDHTEIVLFSAKVPGYWATQLSDKQEFFLSTQVRSYKKGSRVRVEGPFGNAFAAVYRDETGEYLNAYPTNILVVWKIAEHKVQKHVQPPSKKAGR